MGSLLSKDFDPQPSLEPLKWFRVLRSGIGIEPVASIATKGNASTATLGFFARPIGQPNVLLAITAGHSLETTGAVGASQDVNQPGRLDATNDRLLGVARNWYRDANYDCGSITINGARQYYINSMTYYEPGYLNRYNIADPNWKIGPIRAPEPFATAADANHEHNYLVALAGGPVAGRQVCKYGKQTWFTRGNVTMYPYVWNSEVGVMQRAIKVAPDHDYTFSSPGDSGSALVTYPDLKLIGIHVAGVNEEGNIHSVSVRVAYSLVQLNATFAAPLPSIPDGPEILSSDTPSSPPPQPELDPEMAQRLSRYRLAAKIVEAKYTEFISLPGVSGVGCGYKVKDGVWTWDPAFIIDVEKKLSKEELRALGRQPFPKFVEVAEYGTLIVDVQPPGVHHTSIAEF